MTRDPLNSKRTYQLQIDALGYLNLIWSDGTVVYRITPVRAFPFSDPTHGFSLIDMHGHEVLWLDSVDDLEDSNRQLVDEVLAAREFMPVITRIHHVSSFNTPSTWQVDTEKGQTQLVLRSEEHIRRIHGMDSHHLLISDSHGIQFLIRDVTQLDKKSRRLLDRFL